MKKQVLLAAAVGALFSVGAQAQFVVDEFVVAQSSVRDATGANGGVATQIAAAGVMGGFRDLYVTRTAAGGCAVNSPDPDVCDPSEFVSARVNAGAYSMSSGNNLAARSIVRWNGDGGNALNGKNYANAVSDIFSSTSFTTAQNLLLLGSGLAIGSNNDLAYTLEFQIFSGASNVNWSRLSRSYGPGFGPSPAFAVSNFSFVDFTVGGGSGADFSNVGAIQMLVNVSGGAVGTPELDLSIDFLRNIPEPGSLALVGLALLGLGVARKARPSK